MNKEEIIELLREKKTKEAKLNLKEIEMKKILIELENLNKEDYVINMTPVYVEGGKTNFVQSKVENTIIKKEEAKEKLETRIKTIENEIKILKLDVDEINIRLEVLNYIEKEVLMQFYVNDKTLEDIGNFTYYEIRQQTRGPRTIKRIIEKALNKLQEI